MSTILPLKRVQPPPRIIVPFRPGKELLSLEAAFRRPAHRRRQDELAVSAGRCKHVPHWMAPDFDEPLDDFRE